MYTLWSSNRSPSISNCLEKNHFPTLPDSSENYMRKISKEMEFCSTFKINRSVKLFEWKKKKEMAFVRSSRNYQNCSFEQKRLSSIPATHLWPYLKRAWCSSSFPSLSLDWHEKANTSLLSADGGTKFPCQSNPRQSTSPFNPVSFQAWYVHCKGQ